MIAELKDIQSMIEFAEKNHDFFTQAKCFAFQGEMGAGKTTIIQEIIKNMGIHDLQGSPTYSIVNEYETDQGLSVYHLDCYRLKNDAETFELGMEELLSKKKPIFIEWPEKIKRFLPSDTVWVKLNINENHIRTIEIADEYRS
jgi:tRNA threonylcarbamoyladenosine biosynthesis protein TsaE